MISSISCRLVLRPIRRRIVIAVLNRHVNIVTDLRVGCHHIHQFPGNLLGIAVQQPDPSKPLQRTETGKQFRQRLFP